LDPHRDAAEAAGGSERTPPLRCTASPTEVAIAQKGNLPGESYVQLDNLPTVAKDRFVKHLGSLDAATMQEVGRKAHR
jgi:mRNA-degrading endonuclease toxin of MazEF toxin-antitoxin module